MENKIDNKGILELISNSFISSYKKAISDFTVAEKREFAKILPVIFDKWYFSSFFDNSIFSPASTISSLTKNKNCAVFRVCPTIKKGALFFQTISDTANKNSFISDLKLFCDYFSPAASFFKQMEVPPEISEKLSRADRYYWEYMFIMAKSLGLIKPMSSINTNKYQTDEKLCHEFFSNSNIVILKQLTHMAIDIFVSKFCHETNVGHFLIDSKTVISFLKTSTSTDDFLQIVFERFGYSAETLMSAAEEDFPASEESEMIMASAYFIGAALSKWLFAPLGIYLKLFTPLYTLKYNFKAEADIVRPFLLTGCDISEEIFSPCNFFCLTENGKKVFETENKNSAFFDPKSSFNNEQILALIVSYLKSKKTPESKTCDKNIYAIKVSYKKHKDHWKIIEFFETVSLEDIYISIITFFALDYSNKISYSIVNKKGALETGVRVNTPSKFLITGLDWKTNNLILSNPLDRTQDLVLSLFNITSSHSLAVYPRLIRQSRNITLEEREEI